MERWDVSYQQTTVCITDTVIEERRDATQEMKERSKLVKQLYSLGSVIACWYYVRRQRHRSLWR